MKLYLHIGQSKTGTTSLQYFFQKNRQNLIQNKILYPNYFFKKTLINNLNHNSLADKCANLDLYPFFSLDEYFNQINKQAIKYNCHSIILSGESFFGSPQIWRINNENEFYEEYKKKLQRLYNYIKNFDLHLILYLLPPEKWFESVVSNVIRYSGTLGKKVYENDEQFFSLMKPHLNYLELLNLWSKIINPHKFDVIPYDINNLMSKDIVSDFLYKTNIKINYNFNNSYIIKHQSLDRRLVEIKKIINKKNKSKNYEFAINHLLSKFNDNFNPIEKYQISKNLENKIKLFSKPFINEIETEYFKKNDRFKDYKKTTLSKLHKDEINKNMNLFMKKTRSFRFYLLYFFVSVKSYLRNNMPLTHTFLSNTKSLINKFF